MDAPELSALKTISRADGTEFSLRSKAHVTVSGESGEVVGLAIHADSGPQALLHYRAADGVARSEWWPLARLSPGYPAGYTG